MKAFPRVKARHVAIALGFGALSTLLAVWAEMGLMMDTFPSMELTLSENVTIYLILSVVVIAPFIEELAKPLGLYFIWGEERPTLEPEEWAFLGALGGFGFAIVENILYASSMLPYGTEPAIILLGIRFLLPVHVIATTISGFGLGLWLKTKNAKYFAACMFASMLIHGLFNLAATVVG